uniref:Uncharacterized protein n=1 Tax=Romanomermis culicivorax TaxID=13658 RepID=A0A915IGG5_ROMCU
MHKWQPEFDVALVYNSTVDKALGMQAEPVAAKAQQQAIPADLDTSIDLNQEGVDLEVEKEITVESWIQPDQEMQMRTMPMSHTPGTMSSMSQVQLMVAPAKVPSKSTASQICIGWGNVAIARMLEGGSGFRAKRVVGGEEAVPHSAPWMTLLVAPGGLLPVM